MYGNIYDLIVQKAQATFDINNYSIEKQSDIDLVISIPNNSLLIDEQWLYNNIEYIFVYGKYFYQRYQTIQQYYYFFKVLTQKYNIDEDYNKYLTNKIVAFDLEYKWQKFASHLVEFLSSANQQLRILDNLFNKKDFLDYFLKHSQIFPPQVLEIFEDIGISKFLTYDNYSSYYLENTNQFIELLKMHPNIKVPSNLFFDKRLKKIAYDINVENFYYNMNFIWQKNSGMMIIEEHKKFCDYELTHIQNKMLPSLIKSYNQSNNYITIDDFNYNNNFLNNKIIPKIFKTENLKQIPKLQFYQHLSKYIALSLLISYCFETSPCDLFDDIKTLSEFALHNNRKLKGCFIYEFLINAECLNIDEIVSFYQKIKNLDLKGIFYDDWNIQKENLIKQINKNIIKLNDLSFTVNEYGITCYDITNLDSVILVHETNVNIYNQNDLNKLIGKIKNGDTEYICLSLQDPNHQKFYKDGNKDTLKLVYGVLDPKRVGIINHEDAYSYKINEVVWQNVKYKSRLYTLESLMEATEYYNEITYLIDRNPIMPIGILCENNPTIPEIAFAKRLDANIYYRLKK